MTLPQIISSVGWTMFSIALAFVVLHTVNVVVPHVDFFIPSSRIPVIGFAVGVPILLLGGVIGVVGFFGEKIEQWWLER